MAKQTEHWVATGPGEGLKATVYHSSYKAYQFVFYIPKTIWEIPVVKSFFDALSRLGGATVFDEEIGIWKGEKEKTHVFRLVVREGDRPLKKVRKMLRDEIGRMMVILSETKYAQEAMLYTETEIRMCLADKVTRID